MVQAPPRVRPRGKGISSNETLGREGWPDVPRRAPRRPADGLLETLLAVPDRSIMRNAVLSPVRLPVQEHNWPADTGS